MAVLTFTDRCTGCGACLLTCPTHAIMPDGGRLAVRDERCTSCGECVEVCPADAIVEGDAVKRSVHPIEAESYRILRGIVDTAGLGPHSRDVVERIVHTTAEPAWRDDLVLDERALAAGAAALRAGEPLVVDVTMVAAGITTYPSVCLVGSAGARELAAAEGVTRSAAAVRLAARSVAGGVWVVGNAPTALVELLRLAAAGEVRPALVVGLPVGYVGAAEAKAALRASGLPHLSNVSARGGSAVAAAAVNALLYGNPDNGDTDNGEPDNGDPNP
jgi:precorrin-8X/cobalt-precorrin-8 methylmutase